MTCIIIEEKDIYENVTKNSSSKEIYKTECPFDDTNILLTYNKSPWVLFNINKIQDYHYKVLATFYHKNFAIHSDLICDIDAPENTPNISCKNITLIGDKKNQEHLEIVENAKSLLPLLDFSICMLYNINNFDTFYTKPIRQLRKSYEKATNIPKDDFYILSLDRKQNLNTYNKTNKTLRYHLRRGHYHTFNTNNGPITHWIKPQWVGDKTKGKINKNYKV